MEIFVQFNYFDISSMITDNECLFTYIKLMLIENYKEMS